ncbi:MAG: hypothetical protein ACYCZF_13560 [Anaerolineae bacterium]
MSVSCTKTGSTAWQARIEAISALRKEYRFPQYLAVKDAVKQGNEFDVNDYFGVLTHLSTQPNYVLDYVYHYDGMGGFPILYARPMDQAPYRTEADFIQAMKQSGIDETREQYAPYLRIEDSVEGYFDYVVFKVMAAQFYLYWHAAYNDKQIVCDSDALEALLKQERVGYAIPATASLRARLLKLEPVVTLDAETATVRVITFSNWKGFVQETWTISRLAPQHIIKTDSKVLIAYDCGIMF